MTFKRPRERITLREDTMTELFQNMESLNDIDQWYDRDPHITIDFRNGRFHAVVDLLEWEEEEV